MKFSIRDLLWATLVAALICGWIVHNGLWVVSERVNEAMFQQELRLFGEEFQKMHKRIAELEGKPASVPNSQAPASNPPYD